MRAGSVRLCGERSCLPSSGGGFNLVECAVVMACAAILLLASVPAVERLHQAWSLWTGACLMESTLQWGRFHSISANASLMLEVNTEGTSAGWRDPETGSTYGTGVCYLPRGVRIVSSPSKPLRFFPRGNAAPAGSYTMRNGAGSFRVVVSPAGRIRVERL
jgi:Tfp pilus assembly protein FimT